MVTSPHRGSGSTELFVFGGVLHAGSSCAAFNIPLDDQLSGVECAGMALHCLFARALSPLVHVALRSAGCVLATP